MAEIVIPSAVAAGVASGVTLGALGSPPDIALLSGVFCGALVFLLRSKESSWTRKLIYFVVSLAGGFAIAPFVRDIAHAPTWLAAFFSAAGVVTVSILVLDWVEESVPRVLKRLLEKYLPGGDRKHD